MSVHRCLFPCLLSIACLSACADRSIPPPTAKNDPASTPGSTDTSANPKSTTDPQPSADPADPPAAVEALTERFK